MVIETTLLRWIIALPALGVLFHVFVGRRATGAVKWVGPGLVGAAFAVARAAASGLRVMPAGTALHDHVYTWIVAGPFRAEVGLRLDALSAVMALVVTGVGFLIHVYSVGYMHGDRGFARYFAYLNLFTTAMLILVLADNLLLLFVGWEGVGLCSYLLIGFWYEKPENAAAGKKAFLVNRIGDAGFLLGLFLLVWTLGRQGIWTVDITDCIDPSKFKDRDGKPVSPQHFFNVVRAMTEADMASLLRYSMVGLTLVNPGGNLLEILIAAIGAYVATPMILYLDRKLRRHPKGVQSSELKAAGAQALAEQRERALPLGRAHLVERHAVAHEKRMDVTPPSPHVALEREERCRHRRGTSNLFRAVGLSLTVRIGCAAPRRCALQYTATRHTAQSRTTVSPGGVPRYLF